MTSVQLVQVLQVLFPAALQGVNGYTLTVDASGNASILLWNNALGTQPTAAQLTAELAALQLKQSQEAQIAALSASYTANGYADVAYMNTTFPCGSSQLLLLSCTLVQAGTPQGLPSGFQWWDANGKGVSMTLAQLQGLGNAIFAQVYAAYAKLQGLIAEVEAATTIAAVQAVVW